MFIVAIQNSQRAKTTQISIKQIVVYPYNEILSIKMNKIPILAITWMNPEDILHERNHSDII